MPDKFYKTTDKIAKGTFSWGSVKDEFPVESAGEHELGEGMNYFYYDTSYDNHLKHNKNYFWHCECGVNDVNKQHTNGCSFKNDGKFYFVIWRKVK